MKDNIEVITFYGGEEVKEIKLNQKQIDTLPTELKEMFVHALENPKMKKGKQNFFSFLSFKAKPEAINKPFTFVYEFILKKRGKVEATYNLTQEDFKKLDRDIQCTLVNMYNKPFVENEGDYYITTASIRNYTSDKKIYLTIAFNAPPKETIVVF